MTQEKKEPGLSTVILVLPKHLFGNQQSSDLCKTEETGDSQAEPNGDKPDTGDDIEG